MLTHFTPNALSFATTPGAFSLPASTSCPLQYNQGAPVELRSTCPFYRVENTDPERYPPTMVEAECYSCPNCITDMARNEDFHPLWSCEKLMTKVTILRNTGVCINGVYQYIVERINVSTGCTCARERV
ncbi:interleukin 17-like protein [Glandiceps talaboti]